MAVSIVSSETIGSNTFYRNKDFSITFSVASSIVTDASLYFGNSTFGLSNYVTGSTFASAIGFPSTGNAGTLSVDAVVIDPRYVTTATSTSYFGAQGVCADPSGNVYFAVEPQHAIYRLDTSGNVTTFAGTGSPGFTDGARLSATFTNPISIATDGSGTFYVGERYDIRKIDSNDIVSTLAGSNVAGYVDGTGTAARFALPAFISVRSDGSLYVSDSLNHSIRLVTGTGVVTTYAGSNAEGYADGSLSAARFAYPHGLVQANGTLYVADQGNHRIRAISGSTVTTFAGTGVLGDASGSYSTAQFGYPTGLARDSAGALYVCDTFCNVIRKLSNGTVTSYAGTFGVTGSSNGRPTVALFNRPYGLQFVGNDLIVSEINAGDLRRIYIYPEVRPGTFRDPPTGTIVATSNYPITVNSRIDTSWTSVGGVLPLFKYEPFLNSFTGKLPGDILTYGTSSTELLGYLTGSGTSQALFRGPNGATAAYTYPLSLTVRASNGGTFVDDVSTSVRISPARIVYSPCNANLVFYRNEPITPITFSLVSSSAEIMYSATALPNGLTLTTRAASNAFFLSGTPTTQSITSNYTILAQDTLKRTYATQVNIAVNAERLLIDVSGSTAFSGVESNVPITPVTFTARVPPYTVDRSMRYSWTPQLPAGLLFSNKTGPVFGTSYSNTASFDPSFTLTLAGSVTPGQIEIFASNNIRSYTVTLTGVRTSPLPSLSPSIGTPITFTFEPVILFTARPQQAFVGIPVTQPFFYSAKTYFADVSIQSMTVTDGFIPDGLTGTFNSLLGQFDLSGTPTFPATYAFTLQATNSNGLTASLPVVLDVSSDSVEFTSAVDACFNFIQYRDLSNPVTGRYPSNIQYAARAGSGCNVTFSGTSLPAGVTINATTGKLSGIPLVSSGLTSATITAQCLASGASASQLMTYSVSAEVFTFTDASFAVQQNVPITATQITATTLSEQPILRYSSGNLPLSLTITNPGLLSGTVLGSNSGTFAITAYTPYSSGSKQYGYSVSADAVLLQPAVYRTVTAPGSFVSIPISGYSASAVTVSNFRFQSAFPYGLSINPTTGLLSGTLSTSLPSNVAFTLLGSAGLVDGSLGGTMTTTNLTVNRAQMIEIRDQSNLYVYSSDTNGASWSNVDSRSSVVASTIGTNGSNVYLIPTSSDIVLRSTDGAVYMDVSLNQASKSPLMSGVVNKTGTSTWWIGGTLSNGSRTVTIFKSTDNGLTWDAGTSVTTNGFTDRSSNVGTGYNAYLNGGVTLAYKDGVLLLGGNQLLRSTDDGATWSAVSSGLIEVAKLSVDQESVWIAAGSSTYSSISVNTYSTPATSLVTSTDAGLTWTPATGGFNMNAYDIAYGNGAWIASGLHYDASLGYLGQVRYSLTGTSWGVLSAIPSYTYGTIRPTGALAPIGFDETEWKILRTPNDGTVTLYSHPYDTPLTIDWTSSDITSSFPGVAASSRFSSYVAQTIDPGTDVTTITFPTPTTGPTFVAPAQSTFVLWQYMPVPEITFRAVGTEPISYFVSQLPVGLTWNATTRSISGTCMRLGTQSVTVYAKNATGITAFPITIITDVPRIIKRQNGAGAYTSLVRQYTEVNAAQTARDSRALPDQTTGIGEFASPYPPSVVTPSNCPC